MFEGLSNVVIGAAGFASTDGAATWARLRLFWTGLPMSRFNVGFGACIGGSDTIFGTFCSAAILISGGEEGW